MQAAQISHLTLTPWRLRFHLHRQRHSGSMVSVEIGNPVLVSLECRPRARTGAQLTVSSVMPFISRHKLINTDEAKTATA